MPTKKTTNRKTKIKAKAVAARARAAKLKDTKAASAFTGFMDFVRQQGVVGMAVGLAIGAQVGILVKDIVNSLITPLVDLLVGTDGLDGLTWHVQIGSRSALFDFGKLINSTIVFLAVAFVLYFVVIGLKLDKLDKKKD